MSDVGRDDQVTRWAQIESQLRAALDSVVVSDEARRWTLEYLDHNELGLAFDTLVDGLVAVGGQVDRLTLGRLEDAARQMGVLDGPSADRLRSFSA